MYTVLKVGVFEVGVVDAGSKVGVCLNQFDWQLRLANSNADCLLVPFELNEPGFEGAANCCSLQM